jgi:hypothetical protein
VKVVADRDVRTLDAAKTVPVDKTDVDKDSKVVFVAVIVVVDICVVDSPLVI